MYCLEQLRHWSWKPSDHAAGTSRTGKIGPGLDKPLIKKKRIKRRRERERSKRTRPILESILSFCGRSEGGAAKNA